MEHISVKDKAMQYEISDYPDEKNLLNLKQMCEELGISVATGRNWIKLGKIEPQYTDAKAAYFSKAYVESYKKSIQSGANMALKSRRNKRYISGNSLYKSYVSEHCKSVKGVQQLLQIIEDQHISCNDEILQIIVADCAVKLLLQSYDIYYHDMKNALLDFLDGKVSFGSVDKLIRDLLVDTKQTRKWIAMNPKCFDIPYDYEEHEDIIGLLYISCKNIGNRKAMGSYYTPTKIVKKLIDKVIDNNAGNENANCKNANSQSILDPCCGTGNFLLQLPDEFSYEFIYGYDIDDISVKITRLNMALKYKNIDVNVLYKNIRRHNYLLDTDENKFDMIIGNPPWGYSFNDEEHKYLKENYASAKGRNIESYDACIEKSLQILKKDGVLAYILPEAILNVKSHMPIRHIIADNTSIQYLEFMGNTFDKVQCPCIIMQLKNTKKKMSCIGMKVKDGHRKFEIKKERDINSKCFSFNMTDEEYQIMNKILHMDNGVFLAGNAIFALGIVTGSNKEYISNVKTSDNEIILKGSDICKYKVREADNYITYRPEVFQQAAPTEYYRAKEKLLYRFISDQLVFAYDDKQTLSLNSCNVLIPAIPEIKMKYVLAILNSRVAQFIYKRQYNSVKVLRAHIESIPIPKISVDKQDEIIEIVDCLIKGSTEREAIGFYEKLDDYIRKIFLLSESEYKTVKNAVDDENKFITTYEKQ